MPVDSDDKKVFNEDLYLKKKKALRKWDLSTPHWASLERFVRFCVYSSLAPQIAEEPFLDIWKRVLDRSKDRKQLLFPREHTKSSMAKAFICFVLCEPAEALGGRQIRIAFCGESKAFANRSVKAVRRALETNRWILAEYGPSKPSKEMIKQRAAMLLGEGGDPDSISPPEWTQGAFRTALCLEGEMETGVAFEEPSLWSQGMDQSTTGFHGNLYIVDDPVGEKSSKSPARKEKAKGVWYDLQSQCNAGGLIIDIGTRHAVDDLHAMIQDEHWEQFDIEVFNCWGEGRELTREDFRRLPTGDYEYVGSIDDAQVFWPGFGQLEEDIRRGFPLEEPKRSEVALNNLAKKLHSIPPQRWANQYLNRCVALEDQIFHDWMFKHYQSLPARVSSYVLTDSATGRDNRSSYRVVATVSLDEHDVAYIRDLDFGRWGPEQYIERILEHHQRYGAKKILMEKVAWQESFKTVMELKCRITGIPKPMVADIPGRSEVSKLERIEGLEPRLRNGALAFDRQIAGKVCDDKDVWKEMIAQFIRVHELANTKGILLDIPDAISDIDCLDMKGQRICRPHKKSRTAVHNPTSISSKDVMRPAHEARKRAKAGGNVGSLWGNVKRRDQGKKLW